ncbi:MAG: DnaJ domain-containing protein [Methylococcaceae bacterium]|nr:DnaJ domain-containing protein [Methylococcaceae bacterium]
MKSPYDILGLADDATDIEIKQAYLQKVKDNPPDSDQERFQRIHAAYQSIKDNKSRLSHALFTLPTADFDELLDQTFGSVPTVTINSDQLSKLLRASIDEKTLLTALTKAEK